MAKNLVQDGARILWTNNTGSAVSNGQVVVIGNQVGVATVDIADGDVGNVAMEGVYECPKVSAAVIAQGEDPLWDASGSAFNAKGTTPATGDVAGAVTCWEAAGNGQTTVKVKLSTGVGTKT